ncbi:glycosyltransferase family 2 protein [Rhizorhapis sp. SPR117]|uniref:glycosyltransferase family 2 protein n=1 Tax=Rhizorhapis sp. SPR117 TaxID=2912611 RepID=UPI001F492A99|nr:glycosyltransferase family 2 protein [Rhizorhapis sp. SPR117]
MQVAIVIVGFRNLADIQHCLTAIGRSTYGDFEVVICENGGDQAFAALTAALPHTMDGGQPVRAIKAPGNVGYAGGVNIGIGETPRADAWWILNPDTLPHPGALTALVARLAKGDCQAVGGIQYFPDGRVQSDGGRWRPWLARAVSIGHGRQLDEPVDPAAVEAAINYITGASLLISRAFLDTAGPMREDYFLYCEEVEWCLRARRKGMKLGFAPDARVLHNQGASTGSGQSVRTRPRLPIYLDERNKMLVTRDCYPYRLPVAALAALILLALRFLRRGAVRQFAYGLAGWRDGLAGRRGTPDWVD